MNRTTIRLGPLALLLTVISICLTILAILTFTTARADLRLAEKYADTVRERTALDREGQAYLARLAAGQQAPPAADSDGVHRVELTRDGRYLRMELIPDGQGSWQVLSWRQGKEWEEKETMDELWSGSFGKEG